jgi:hypothetical protein
VSQQKDGPLEMVLEAVGLSGMKGLRPFATARFFLQPPARITNACARYKWLLCVQ